MFIIALINKSIVPALESVSRPQCQHHTVILTSRAYQIFARLVFFGLFKQKFRRADVGCLNDIADIVRASATVNSVQLVGSQEGEVLVPAYDWTGFLAPQFKRIPGIKKIHHFHFESQSGKVDVREWSDSTTKSVKLLRDEATLSPAHADTLPDQVAPWPFTRETVVPLP